MPPSRIVLYAGALATLSLSCIMSFRRPLRVRRLMKAEAKCPNSSTHQYSGFELLRIACASSLREMSEEHLRWNTTYLLMNRLHLDPYNTTQVLEQRSLTRLSTSQKAELASKSLTSLSCDLPLCCFLTRCFSL